MDAFHLEPIRQDQGLVPTPRAVIDGELHRLFGPARFQLGHRFLDVLTV